MKLSTRASTSFLYACSLEWNAGKVYRYILLSVTLFSQSVVLFQPSLGNSLDWCDAFISSEEPGYWYGWSERGGPGASDCCHEASSGKASRWKWSVEEDRRLRWTAIWGGYQREQTTQGNIRGCSIEGMEDITFASATLAVSHLFFICAKC